MPSQFLTGFALASLPLITSPLPEPPLVVRNKRPDLNGLLLIDKPLSWTSFDVVRKVRSLTGGAKVGHAGTLDPLATGLLILCLGKATKSIDRLMADEKAYHATVNLSGTTPTDDLESPVTPFPVDSPPSRSAIEATIASRFIGTIAQAPPAHSAILVDGQRAYDLARQGKLDALPTRPITIHAIDIAAYHWPILELDIRCGKGTYIRSLARDLGQALGTGGYLAGLRRTRIGRFSVEQAHTPESLDPALLPLFELEPPPAA